MSDFIFVRKHQNIIAHILGMQGSSIFFFNAKRRGGGGGEGGRVWLSNKMWVKFNSLISESMIRLSSIRTRALLTTTHVGYFSLMRNRKLSTRALCNNVNNNNASLE